MKNVLITAFIFTGLIFFNSCEKCYKCHNVCQRCQQQYPDTTLSITVCSDVFGEQYYNEYLDSLKSQSLQWTCTDAGSTRIDDFCGSKTNNSIKLINRKEEGWICGPK
jgi:hypothetical protein